VLDALWEHGGGKRQNVPPRALFVHMDIRDEAITRIFQEFKPEIVSHHAAQASVAIGSRDPVYDAQVNVVGLLNVLENSVRYGVKKIIYASSGATFGTPERLPMNETTPQRPESPYGTICAFITRSAVSTSHRCATATSTARAKIQMAKPA